MSIDSDDTEEAGRFDSSALAGGGGGPRRGVLGAGAAVKGAFQGLGQRARAASQLVRGRGGSADQGSADEPWSRSSSSTAGESAPLTPRRRRVLSVDEPEGESPGQADSPSAPGSGLTARSGNPGGAGGRRQSVLLGGALLRRGGGLALLTRGDRVRHQARGRKRAQGGVLMRPPTCANPNLPR